MIINNKTITNKEEYNEDYITMLVKQLRELNFSEEEQTYINKYGIDVNDAKEWTGNTRGITAYDKILEELKNNDKVAFV